VRPELRIAYVVSRWGEPTQTFVRREAEAVAALGVDVSALSLKRPRPTSVDVPVTRLRPAAVVLGCAAAFVRHPRRVAGVVAAVLGRASLRNVLPLLAAALTGVAWASRGAGRGAHLHAHFGWVAATAAWAAARVTGCPYSVVLHAFELHTRARHDRFTPIPLREATQVFAISSGDARWVAETFDLGVDVLRMGVPRPWLLEGDRTTVDAWHIVSVGSLLPKKGHDVLLRALAQADEHWSLTIVGEGPEREALDRLAVELGIADRVRLAGRLDETQVRELLDHATVSVLACRIAPDGDRDGIPVSLMEAMARRVPVISTRVSAIVELVDGAGIVVEPDDPAAIASALDELSAPARRDELAECGRQRVADDFVVERSAARVISLVDGVGTKLAESPAQQVGHAQR
jgi:colanic acid/amylovoran biosynthesis glycosyltransferase